MKKTVRMLLILTVFLMAASMVFAQGGEEQAADDGPSVVQYWYPWGGGSEEWDQWRIGEFEKTHPEFIVESTFVPDDGGLSNGKLLAAIAGGNPPDVVVSNSAPLAYTMATTGGLASLDAALERAGFSQDQLLDPFIDLMKYDGKTYVFPHDTNVNIFYYNKDLFAAAGLDPERPPQTMAELDEYAEKLTKITPNGDIEQAGFIPWQDFGDDAFFWGWMFGTTYFDAASNKLTFASENQTAVYDWMRTYAERLDPTRITALTSGFGGAFTPDHPFYTGKVAMTINGNWFTNAIKINMPDINYGVGKVPAPDNGRPGGTTFGTNVFVMPKGAENEDGAIAFMLFASQPSISADNINTWRSLSVWKKEDPSVIWYQNGDPIYAMELEIANNPNSGHPALTSVATQLSTELNLVRDKVLYDDDDPAVLLDNLQNKLQKEVDK